MMCGSCSIENSFKLMYFKHMDKVRGGRAFNQEEMESCMINQVSFNSLVFIKFFSSIKYSTD